jgi:formylglycine-generating enzyme required for sulfatase activity
MLEGVERKPFEPEMLRIPAGTFLMGDKREEMSLPDYYIAKTPITNAQYWHFVQAGGKCPAHWKNGKIPADKEDHPVIMVSWGNAASYCHWLSIAAQKPYRLPTEQEWEKAARGIDGRE